MTLPAIDLIVARLKEYDSTYELRPGTPFYETFIKPLTYILNPTITELEYIQLNQSFRRIVELPDPNAHDEDAVDALAGNVFVDRVIGGKASGVGRIYYQTPVDVVWPASALTFTSAGGQTYVNAVDINITYASMARNIDRDLYFLDVGIVATDYGEEYTLPEADMLIQVSDPIAVTCTNRFPITGGINRETNVDFIKRTKDAIALRDMNTGKGIRAIMFEKFSSSLLELQPVGFLDPEMKRDIVYNTHIGGKIDSYVKTLTIETAEFNAIGLLIDETRRISTVSFVYLIGTDWASLRVPRVDNADRNPIVSSSVPTEEAVMYSYADLVSPVNMVGAERIKITLDDVTREMYIAGSVPASTIINEISRKINNAFGRTASTIAINPTVVNRRDTGYTLVDGVNDSFFFDATPNAFQNVNAGDNLYIYVGPNLGTVAITAKVSNNILQMATPFTASGFATAYRINRVGFYLKFTAKSLIAIAPPDVGNSALLVAFGMNAAGSFVGVQPTIYNESVGYEIDYAAGRLRRIIGPTVIGTTLTGVVNKGFYFYDLTTIDAFDSVQPGDMLTIITSPGAESLERDYRVQEVVNSSTLRIDRPFEIVPTGDVTYYIHRTEILDGENTSVDFDYNPLSIDVGGLVPLDEYGRVRGVRPGRESYTITDMPLLAVTQIELIDPVTLEPLNQVLESRGGYGRGGYGRGGYGRGIASEWRLKVLDPTVRFSMWENSVIQIDPSYETQSFKVTFLTAPDVAAYQAFADSEVERVLDAHVLMKHFVPALVDITVYYAVDPTNPNTPANDSIVSAVKKSINSVKAGNPLDVSDVVQIILSMIDPTNSGKARVQLPTTMYATVHNSNGTKTILSSQDQLVIPDNTTEGEPDAPLTPRIAHWIANNIVLNRI
jgi:hypothetical protein